MVEEPQTPRIVNRGRGPELEGTRITVYAIMEYLEGGLHHSTIAAVLGLSSAQVLCAIDYIERHKQEVTAEYRKIMARIAEGNPPEIRKLMDESHERFLERVEEWRRNEEARGAANHGRP
jgi:uncharacterized protein (DUF433 family)